MSDFGVLKGGCLCKAVGVSATKANLHFGACHCDMCRKWSGGAFLGVECGRDVSFSGAENITIYPSSEWAERGFCQKCGSHLFYKFKPDSNYYIPAGIFDNDEGLVFDHQIFIDEKPEYYTFANETKNMTGAEVVEMFAPQLEK